VVCGTDTGMSKLIMLQKKRVTQYVIEMCLMSSIKDVGLEGT